MGRFFNYFHRKVGGLIEGRLLFKEMRSCRFVISPNLLHIKTRIFLVTNLTLEGTLKCNLDRNV